LHEHSAFLVAKLCRFGARESRMSDL
jgi:hypothetical protein